MKIRVVHGFNAKKGAQDSTDRLIEPLVALGHDADDWDYGWLGLIGVRLYTNKIAKRIAEKILKEKPDVLIAHSNGANVVNRALWYANEMNKGSEPISVLRVIYLSPALNRDMVYPPIPFGRVHVFFTQRDRAVRAAELLWFHPWGAMGALGATGEGYVNHDFTVEVGDHCAWFCPEVLPFTINRIKEVIQ